jgi:predicted nucleic acid-binding protein
LNVLVDTSVWSLALRRKAPDPRSYAVLMQLIADGRAAVIGSIRQELLSGVRDNRSFERLRDYLRSFPDEPLLTTDYEQAAVYFNTCRARGIQGSNTDFLICAVAERMGWAVFTQDDDFQRYAAHIPVRLFAPP